MSPRFKEDNTHLDLAIGSIQTRGTTRSGIELAHEPNPWVCFVEAKWGSDIATHVTNDMDRNQLARVAENALTFQAEGRVVDTVVVTLLTPRRFRTSRSRFYTYKYEEYRSQPQTLLADLEHSPLPPRNSRTWTYPSDLADRAARLQLHWVTYEDLVSAIPESPLRRPIRTFHGALNTLQ